MNAREKNYLDMLLKFGIALMEEGRKTGIDQNRVHGIDFEPETGYVYATVNADGKIYTAMRFDRFPEVDYQEYERGEKDERERVPNL